MEKKFLFPFMGFNNLSTTELAYTLWIRNEIRQELQKLELELIDKIKQELEAYIKKEIEEKIKKEMEELHSEGWEKL